MENDLKSKPNKKQLFLISLTLFIFVVLLGVVVYKKSSLFNVDQVSAAVPIRGEAGDKWADLVIGKPDFGTVAVHQTVNNKLFWSSGVIVDRTSTPNKIYIFDSNNNRILGMDLARCLATQGNGNCVADIVIGQPSFNTSGCNGDSGFQLYPQRAPASNSTLCLQPENVLSVEETGSGGSMDIDEQGNLYVVDNFNNRVLKYNRPFDQWTQNGRVVANEVWGQNDFTGNLCNKGSTPNATSLCYQSWTGNNNFTAGVEIDQNNNLWVTDNNNQRVLRFPFDPQTSAISKTADRVLGQTVFTANGAGSGLNQFNGPAAVRMNSRGWIYVADQGNHRIMVYENPTTGTNARVFASNINPSPFELPQGVDFDPFRPGKVWLSVRNNRTIELWDEDTQTKTMELGRRGDGNVLGDPAGSLGFDSSGNLYYSTITGGNFKNDVVMYNNPTASQIMPNKNFFGTSSPGNALTQSSLFSVRSVVVSDGQLIVLDSARVMFWNIDQNDPLAPLTNGKPADGVIIGSSFTDNSRNWCCSSIKADKNHHLYLAKITSPYQIEVYNLPLVSNAQPVSTIRFPLNVINGQQIAQTINGTSLWGMAPTDNSSHLWITDTLGSRVMRIRNPLTAPQVDVVIGQSDLTSTSCNRGAQPISGASATTLCTPGSITLDRNNNLWVSDHSLEIQGNMRLLEYNANLFPTNNESVIFSPSASKIFPNHAVFEVAFDSQNRMVVGFNPYWTPNPKPANGVQSRWLAYYLNPLSASTTPDGFFNDYSSLQFALHFDEQDNLYFGDLNRGHVLIYKKPFLAPTNAPTPTNTPIPTATSAPTAVPTPLSSPTPTPINFQAEYFNNKNVSGRPVMTRVDPEINFNWGLSSPDPSVNMNGFSVKWTRTYNFTSGIYIFSASHNDGMRVFIDNKRVYNQWSNQDATNRTFNYNMTTGNHTIVVEYYDNNGLASVNLRWVKQ